jgi:hypothetical protein
MGTILILCAGIFALVIELLGVMHSRKGKVDTFSELWWWLTEHTNRPGRWLLNGAMIAFLTWLALHLVVH